MQVREGQEKLTRLLVLSINLLFRNLPKVEKHFISFLFSYPFKIFSLYWVKDD